MVANRGGSSRIQIDVCYLRPGLYVTDLGVHWAKHPFLKNQFELDAQSILKIRGMELEKVEIDLDRSSPEAVRDLYGPAWVAEEDDSDNAESESEPAHEDTSLTGAKGLGGSAKARPGKVTREARRFVRGMLEGARAGKSIDMKDVNSVTEEIYSSLCTNKNAMLALGRVRSLDGYTYQHSVNVGVLMMAFGRYLEMDHKQVQLLGAAGLLHDIGKAFVPEHILLKPDRLSNEEYKTIKAHPSKGAQLLRGQQGIHPLIVEVAEKHHERVDGTGYPFRLEEKQLRREVMMAAIVDVYDAVTAVRAYHRGKPPAGGLKVIIDGKGSHFNSELAYDFVRCIGVYPVGSLVRTNADQLGIVLECTAHEPSRPMLRVVYDIKRDKKLTSPYILDLGESASKLQVVGYEDPEKWSIKPEKYLGY
ncbi:HD-GYP domain-containing protein [Halorhodospira halochloris]|uniref:HD-GYP domain-containing protein n=1 Tax=Halorhodospira halochloris TaxID=1052 RepID=UPI001EE95AB1|nr:HD-GYP domain-containing protein [Halorhodospira halochloris]MCG5548805.1 HD-GYP domain-containing protein [Halorhodospira halochloris]